MIHLSLLQEEEVDEKLELLVLASDGLWDAVPNEVSFHIDAVDRRF